MIHDCGQFDRWLDGGREASLAGAARAHAAGCARCAGIFELEECLADPPSARADAAFTERVMFRVRDGARARAAARLARQDEVSWWLRAPAEPPAALALALAALLAWRGDGLWAFAVSLALRVRAHDWTRGPGSETFEQIHNPFAGLPTGTLGSAALLSVMLVVVGAASWVLFHATRRLVADAGPRHAPLRASGTRHAR